MKKMNLNKRLLMVSLFVLVLGSMVKGNIQAVIKTEGEVGENPGERYQLSEKVIPQGGREELRLYPQEQASVGPAYVPDQIIIKFKLGPLAQAFKKSVHSVENLTLKGSAIKQISGLPEEIKALVKHETELVPVFEGRHTKMREQRKPEERINIETYRRLSEKRRMPISETELKNYNLANIYLLKDIDTPEGKSIKELSQEISSNPGIEYAEPNYIYYTNNSPDTFFDESDIYIDDFTQGFPYTLPNDTYINPSGDGVTWSSGAWGQDYEDVWGLKVIEANSAWPLSQGAGVVVAVIDTGVDYNHEDIAENIWVNQAELNGEAGVDDDGNGYIDDIRGWNFTYDGNSNDPMDNFGHGSHVSGTIAAVGNNGLGIIGVAPETTIMPVKGLGDQGHGYTDELAEAIVYAAMNGADVLNNSWGSDSRRPSDPTIEDAVRTAYEMGAVVVFAAGNSNDDVIFYSPQNMTNPKPIVVAASTQVDTPTFFTNFGLLIDVAAPGGGTTDPPPAFEPFRNILSLKSNVIHPDMSGNGQLIVGEQYLRQAGTSMSAPHAAGVAALMLTNRPDFTSNEVRQVLRVSADDIGTQGVDLYTGSGRIDAANALTVDSILNVQITDPDSWTTLNQQQDTISIIGTANGENFQQYQLYYGIRFSPEEWIPIGEPVYEPVENGLLGTWQIRELAIGSYWLKLVATTFDDLQFHDVALVFIEGNIQQFTDEPQEQWFPDISWDRLVWTDSRNGWADIYLYDFATQQEQQITNNSRDHYGPAISGDRIVWGDTRNFNGDIYLYDLNTQQEQQITSDPAGQGSPSISESQIVWEDYRNGNFDIYLYDLITQQEQRITSNSAWQRFPRIFGSLIGWTDDRNGNFDIYLYDLDTQQEQQFTSDPADQLLNAISGNLILFTDRRNGNKDIYLYDLITQQEQQITSDPADQTGADISGDKIVWQDNRNGNWDIYLYNLTTGEEQQITANFEAQYDPHISGNRIVWTDSRNDNQDIYLYEIPNQPPILNPIGDKSGRTGSLITFTVTATDEDMDPYLELVASPMPEGAQMIATQDYTPGFVDAMFLWTPSYNQVGVWSITFTVTDSQGLEDSETIDITVSSGGGLLPKRPFIP